MSPLVRFTLIAVVFVDLLGQGLVVPIISTMLVDPKAGFLPAETTAADREFYFGLVLGSFFLFWFLGVAYVSRLSDVIGRKRAMLICLLGCFVGYVLTIVAIAADSLWLLIVGRAITGFTAGNQPIAQAAMVDLSRSDEERTRNMGYIVAGISAGLVFGPIISGLLADPDILGSSASIALPFYAALVLVVAAIALLLVFYRDTRTERTPFVFKPFEMFTLIGAVFRQPLALRVSAVYACFIVTTNAFYIFIDNYLDARFGIGLLGASAAMLVLGVALALSSTLLVGPVTKRFGKGSVVATALIAMGLCALLFVATDVPAVSYAAIFVAFLFFGVTYPILLGLFSASVGPDRQGWIMGVATAEFTLLIGILSMLGGDLMGLDIRLPFFIAAGSAILGLAAQAVVWRQAAFRKAVQLET